MMTMPPIATLAFTQALKDANYVYVVEVVVIISILLFAAFVMYSLGLIKLPKK